MIIGNLFKLLGHEILTGVKISVSIEFVTGH